MSTLNIIGEFFHNEESRANHAAARELTLALAQTAPRAHASTMLIASDTNASAIDHVKANVARIPIRSSVLPVMWQSNQSARPLDGEYLHALSPLAPLRTREEHDGSQTSVMIPHTIAWDAPDLLPRGQARQLRAFVRRAIKHADTIVAPTHHVAKKLREIFGDAIDPTVLPLAAPREYLGSAGVAAGSGGADGSAGADGSREAKGTGRSEDAGGSSEPTGSAARRKELGLPEKYLLTRARPGEFGRLEWILEALRGDSSLPHLIVVYENEKPALVGEDDPEDSFDEWQDLADRVTLFKLAKLDDMGHLIEGATALLMPQQVSDSMYEVYGALAQGIPVVHGNDANVQEITLESSVGSATPEGFADALKQLVNDETERERLNILAKDRSKSFTWGQTAWQLWEIHANI